MPDLTYRTLTAKAPPPATAAQVLAGLPHSKARVLRVMSAADWEEFIEEWLHFHRAKGAYKAFRRYGGAGDLGLDVVGFTGDDDFNDPWDSFQAKHYDTALEPAKTYVELGKLIYHSFNRTPPYDKRCRVPRKHSFVAPCGTGTKLSHLLRNPARLKEALRAEWSDKCQVNAFGKDIDAPLAGTLLTYFDAFDFSIFSDVTPAVLIEQHAQTVFHVARFGGGLPPRPHAPSPPPLPTADESRYLTKLLAAYGETLGSPQTADTLPTTDASLYRHYTRQRASFYCAEGLKAYSRETLVPGTFEDLQDDIHAGVIDTCESTYGSMLERLKATITCAGTIAISGSPLSHVAKVRDKHGICHQLANADRLDWEDPSDAQA